MFLPVSLIVIGLLFTARKMLPNVNLSKYVSMTSSPALDGDTRENVACVTPEPTSNLRSTFGIQPGAFVRGWPSTGGIYVLESCDGVELQFLGLDRFNITLRSEDPTDEDMHCANMRKLGATWWTSEYAYNEKHLLNPEGPDLVERVVIVGWPTSGGVWVLGVNYEEAIRRGVGKIKNAFSMEERCRLIKMLGGVFYANPGECPDLDLGGTN